VDLSPLAQRQRDSVQHLRRRPEASDNNAIRSSSRQSLHEKAAARTRVSVAYPVDMFTTRTSAPSTLAPASTRTDAVDRRCTDALRGDRYETARV